MGLIDPKRSHARLYAICRYAIDRICDMRSGGDEAVNSFIATPGLCRLGVGSSSGAGGRLMAYLGPMDSLIGLAALALDRPNHLSTYLLGP